MVADPFQDSHQIVNLIAPNPVHLLDRNMYHPKEQGSTCNVFWGLPDTLHHQREIWRHLPKAKIV